MPTGKYKHTTPPWNKGDRTIRKIKGSANLTLILRQEIERHRPIVTLRVHENGRSTTRIELGKTKVVKLRDELSKWLRREGNSKK